MYILLSFMTGVIVVLNMMLNAKLSQKLGSINGIIINYTVATVSSIFLCFIMVNGIPSYSNLKGISLPYFLGGIIGVVTTYFFNIIVPKVPAFYVVVLRFIGQILTSAVIDYIYFDIFSKGKIIGGILFLIGLVINARVDYKYKEVGTVVNNKFLQSNEGS